MRDDLGAAPLFEKEPLEQVGRPDHAPMAERKAQMRDAGVEIVLKALLHSRQLAFVGRYEVLAEHAGQRWRRRLVAAAGPRRDLGPQALRRFAAEIAQAVDQAALAQRPRKA